MEVNFEPAPFFWIEEGKEQASTPKTAKKIKRKKEFVGWGSRELIGFLESIGKDTTKVLSQYDVSNIVNQYVNENKLAHPKNKRRVLCDERLLSLFGKKSFFRNKVHELAGSHLAENQDDSDDDHFGSSDENDEGGFSMSKKQKTVSLDKKVQPKKKAPEVSKSCLAAIDSNNVKLVYLRKSLIQEILNNSDSFESKVVGSFVRVKSDPHDIFQKNSHQLQLVTGVVEVASAGETRSSTLLQISGMTDDISIPEISDDNFSEEEIEDLRNRVKDGLLKQPTVGELEQKAAVLHEDITKHWLARELVLLKKLIDRANEKGWRHRVTEYLDRRKLLQSPDEQSRLFSEIPRVMPEVVRPETISDCAPDDSPKAADWDWEPSSAKGDMTNPEVKSWEDNQAAAEISTRSNGDAHPFSPEERNQLETYTFAAVNNGHAHSLAPKEDEAPKTEAIRVETNGGDTDFLNLNHAVNPNTELRRESNGHVQLPSSKEPAGTQVQVIDLSDDDDEEQEIPNGGTEISAPHTEQLLWNYLDPQGRVQGPFSLASLKRWNDFNYFPLDFKVWMSGQSPQEAILLSHILHHIFPN
ncbi:uncharacterized protein At5g08430 isoform X1 [Beta vulgaris subsp. vulgaris]|uniref:uncharacterized protein At5g08430 isoform X1 n=1 Tax=Beta vulgaris subsp. vulgaris TaxID=3555 RepID=UPI0020369533|nr:uncharacterized protein At5g08430 isoform X1 [Beta vulgaris subsp. vulgaris]XP_048499397.1 uncharacterized protein At5g08430 isoform X1 [Beta vulgaris subsp. vulgaris]